MFFVGKSMAANMPAIVVEPKYDKSAGSAIEQIIERKYTDCIKDYHGEMLLVGINNCKEKNSCEIEKLSL